VAESLRAGLGAINEGENHFVAAHFSEHSVEEIEQSEDHDAFIEMNGSIEVVTYCTDISCTVFQGAVNAKVMDDAKRCDHNSIPTLLDALQVTNSA
tara:strand:+ start:377 stop:664 length:288 start_codon:yes stop_codon:yes gene_type:complete